MHNVNANGAQIPALGFGTWELRGRVAYDMTAYALSQGYRHVDTAQMYQNETEVGAAIKDAAVASSEVFLTTKIWPDQFRAADLRRAAEQSVRRLKVDSVDLLLLHWPSPDIALAETLGALGALRQAGLARHIGISNFTVALIEQALAQCSGTETLAVNQVEYHPYLDQTKILATLRANGMALTAYSPIARGQVFHDSTIRQIAETHNKNPAQIALRWLVQQDSVIAIPRSSSERHAASNLAIFDFALSDDEMRAISALARPDGRIVDPAGLAPAWDAA